jgi:uncharacterized repeat protein (TIGR03803 family)
MGTRRFSHSMLIALAILGVLALPVSASWASTTTVTYSFAGDADGEYPSTDLVTDGAGNLYGTTVQGGQFGGGTVFELIPTGGGWTHSVLYSFKGASDGGQPYGGVTLDAQGNLFGTAVVGGTGGVCIEDGCGVVFELTKTGGGWSERVIHNFTGGNDGYGPGAGVTFDTAGNLYGMTPTGGSFGLGVIYELKPGPGGNWAERVIHTFTGGKDGATGSAGRLTLDDTGHLFGVATVGGAHGAGTAFELANASGKWRLRPLYAFKGQPDAGFPYGGLAFDSSGHLFGTTYYDGANDLGAVYELGRNSAGQWSERVLYSFSGGQDGSNSISSLVFDGAGNLYGTTSEGGAPGCGCGTIFKLAPEPDGTWTESVAYRFTGPPDAAFAYNGMVANGAGHFYGTTVHGGADNEGAVYSFTP